MPQNKMVDVLVVGAGPVGLMMAAELSRRGIVCRIIDKAIQPMHWVKALGVSLRTLEIFDQLELLAPILDSALVLEHARFIVDRQEASVVSGLLQNDVPFPLPISIPQYDTERVLANRLLEFGIMPERGVELVSFTQSDHSVVATLKLADGSTETVEARYLAGCDGARSQVRKSLGFSFDGDRFPMDFLLIDVAIDWETPRNCATLLMETKDGQMDQISAVIPYPDRSTPHESRYRISAFAQRISDIVANGPQQVAEDQLPTVEEMEFRLGELVPFPVKLSSPRWSSRYRISHRLVPNYSEGRVFLAGDAAHIHPPTGGQGMNTGLQDAFNLAWKLAAVIKGRSPESLLDSYSEERHPIGKMVVEGTTKTSENPTKRFTGDSQANLRVDSQLWHHYRASSWVAGSGEAVSAAGTPTNEIPQAGDRVPDVFGLRRHGVGFPMRLRELLRHPGSTIIAYIDPQTTAADWDQLEKGFLTLAKDLSMARTYLVVQPGTDFSRATFGHVIIDGHGEYRSRFGADANRLVWIRPDSYFGAMMPSLDVTGLLSLLSKSYVLPS